MDTIQFESRREIQVIYEALENSPKKNDKEVNELMDLLDVMHMEW